jgi:DNA repair protein RecN (Recombination protein N)
MLRELTVENYAIIEQASIHLVPGLNVLTGETGAGKSIIVGALNFVLGDRVTDDVVRKGAERCWVEAIFEVGSRGRAGYPPELESVIGDSSLVRLSREISKGGRSRCSINDKSIPVAQVRDLGNLLVDFHGQHEHQQLLHVRSHIDFLDGFGRLLESREQYSARREALLDSRRRIAELQQEIAYIRSREDSVKYEIQEIEQLELEEDEDVKLEREMKVLEHAEKIIGEGTKVVDALYDTDHSVIDLLAEAEASLAKIAAYADRMAPVAESLEQAEVIVKEAAETIRSELSRIDMDPSRLEALRERRAIIERMKRKYGETLSDVLRHLQRLKAGVENRGDLEQELSQLEAERHALEQQVADSARILSERRRAAGKRFERLAEKELRSLGIAGGGFTVVFEDVEEGVEVRAKSGEVFKVGELGKESVEFFVRTNPGEDMLPLRRIASGGEISRVMLGLKKILAEVDEVDSLVFDEVDSGIGGTMADVIAGKLHEVARSRQVVCITHLAQIAGSADLHLHVGKSAVRGRTVTRVVEVDGEARVRELARMIGGKQPPRSARMHAEEILKRSVEK